MGEERCEWSRGRIPITFCQPPHLLWKGGSEGIAVIAHVVGVLALNGVVAADLSIPCAVFDSVAGPDGEAFYEVRVCGEDAEVHARHFGLRVPYGVTRSPGRTRS